MTRLVPKLLLACFSFVTTLALAEATLQLLIRQGLLPSFASRNANVFADDVLGFKLPGRIYPEIDRRGYRNPEVLDRADIVALGDSQTYGYNASFDESWPNRLASLRGESVYNMGVAGRGPAQYALLAEDALALRPRHLVVGLYLGNDLLDACRIFGKAHWQRYARERSLDYSACTIESGPAGIAPSLKGSARFSELFMLAKEIPLLRAWLMLRRDLGLARTKPDQYYSVEHEDLRTVVPLYRYSALRLDDPEVRRGLELTLYFLDDLIAKARASDAEVSVLLIPTKASSLYELLIERGDALPARYEALVDNERRVAREIAAHLDERKVVNADALREIQRGLRQGEQIFLRYSDGHPLPPGYARMARAINEVLAGS